MQLFAVAVLDEGAAAPDLGAALLAAARPFAALDAATLAVERSRSGRVACGRISHGPAVAAPRRYAARAGDALVLFDGFPIERHGRFAGHDAHALAERWGELPDCLEGIFSAVRVDLAEDEVECLLDVLGLAPAFLHRGDGVLLLANSVEAIRHAAGVRDADPLGLASMVALGWPAADRAALAGVERLRGGGVHRLRPGAVTFAPRFTPATTLAVARDRPPLPQDQLLATTRAAVTSGAPIGSALSGGRDTRLLLALARATHADVDFYTDGAEEHPDVRVARAVAAHFGLRHRVLRHAPPEDPGAWADATTMFVRRTDGLSPIDAISDLLDHDGMPDRLGLELWGVAGEIGRTNRWVTTSLASVAPVARRSYALQRQVVRRAHHDPAGLLRPEAAASVRSWIDGFLAERRDEGWPPEALYGTFYAFGRVRHWSARGVRRAAATTDLFSPFASRAYVEHAFGLSPQERYVERPHRRLIAAYAPEVDTVPYEHPWWPDRPERALWIVLGEGARRARHQAERRLRRDGAHGVAPLGARWLEAGLALHRDVALSSPGSAVWDVVDRGRYEALLATTPEQRSPFAVGLGRVMPLLWYLDGPGR